MSILGDGMWLSIGKMTNLGQNKPMYIFDFSRNFFSSPEGEMAGRDHYYNTMDDFENLCGKVAASAENLLRALQLYENVLVEFVRHDTYHYLRYAVNTKDLVSKSIYARMEAEFAERTAFLRQELIHLDRPVFNHFVEQKPELEAYRYAVEFARRYRPHSLSLEAETILNNTAIDSEWEYGLYEVLVQRTSFGSLKTKVGELDVLRHRTAISTHPDRGVREAGFKQLYAGYASQRDLYAYALINLVKRRNRLAQIHHFDDAPGEVYFNSYWSKAQVSGVLKQVEQQAGIYMGYQRLRAEHASKKLGVEEVNPWDIAMSLPGELPRAFPLSKRLQLSVRLYPSWELSMGVSWQVCSTLPTDE